MFWIVAGGVVALMVCCALFFALMPKVTEAEHAMMSRVPATLTSVPDPYSRLVADITEALGNSNRDIERVTRIEFSEEHREIIVEWTINDIGFVTAGAQKDTVDILKAAYESGLPYEVVAVYGTFPLVDDFGNRHEETVVYAYYASEIIAKINWDNFSYTKVWDIADAKVLHPDLEN